MAIGPNVVDDCEGITEEDYWRGMDEAMQEIGLLPKLDQWIVIDPQGRMYKGTVEQVTRVLVQAHPLMRTPFELSGSHDG